MVYSNNGMAIQAVPISADTFLGVATNQACAGKVVHVNADSDITFHFPDSVDIALPAVSAGMDFVADARCTGVTSTASVLIS